MFLKRLFQAELAFLIPSNCNSKKGSFMKKRLVSILTVAGILLATGVFAVAATQAEPSDNTGSPKTVAISNVPAGQANSGVARSGSIYDQIMQSQERMNKRMDKFFNDPVFGNSPSRQALASLPNMSMGYQNTRFLKKDDAYVLQLIMPGVDKKNISIELHGNVLTVSTKNSAAIKSNNSNNYQSYQNISNAFTQSFTIPPDVDVPKITSDYKNGVLTVKLPKDLSIANRKAINISVE